MPNSLPVNSEKSSTHADACASRLIDPSSNRGRSCSALDYLIERGADLHIAESWPGHLDQDGASAFLLHVCGVKLAPRSLQKRGVVGGSPPFQKFGARVAYPRDLLKDWGDAQAGPVINSTAELPTK